MALPDDLMQVAVSLTHLEAGKPRQASLRRAVSTAYYALFHAIIGTAADRMLVNEARRRAYGGMARRAFTHRGVRDLAEGVMRQPQNRGKVGRVLQSAQPGPRLVQVATALAQLYDKRERADYDVDARYQRGDVEALVTWAQEALAAWQQVQTMADGEAFLVAVMLFGRGNL